MKFCKLIILMLGLLALPTWASPETEIEAAYTRSCLATEFKFLPGMMSHRSSKFKAFSADGREINTLGEEQKLAALLANSLSAKESVKIRSTVKNGDGSYTCHVEDRIVLMVPKKGAEPQEVVIITESKDKWKQTPLGWRQFENRLISQKVENTAGVETQDGP